MKIKLQQEESGYVVEMEEKRKRLKGDEQSLMNMLTHVVHIWLYKEETGRVYFNPYERVGDVLRPKVMTDGERERFNHYHDWSFSCRDRDDIEVEGVEDVFYRDGRFQKGSLVGLKQ